MQKQIDIVDKYNRPTGRRLSINEAMKEGAWHRGARVVICTTTGYVLVQKRSPAMVTDPGYLEFSVGGFVDAGEAPEQTAIREVREELGLNLGHDDLDFAGVFRLRRQWPALHKKGRTFSYVYIAVLPSHEIDLTLQPEEVTSAEFISTHQLASLIRRHRIKSLGRLEPTYRYYRAILSAAERRMRASRKLS